MTGNPLQPITDYLADLQGCLMFGRCAGKTTRLSKLHQNRLISDDHRLFQLDKLETMCNAIIETNFSQEIDLDSDLLQRISAITGLYYADDVGGDEVRDWNERDKNPLWPYWCARWFDEQNKQFHVDEDMEVISPSITEEDRANGVEFCEKMLANGLSDLLTFENLQSIEDGVKELYDNILLTMSHKDAKAEYEFIQAKQNIEEKIVEQEAYIKERRAELEEFQDAMKNFPGRDLLRKNLLNEFDREEQHLTQILERELEIQADLVERKHIVEMKIKKSMLEAKSSKISPGLSRFITFYESNNHSLFGDIPTFIQSILLGEVPLNDVIQVMNDDGGLVSIIGDPGFGKTIQLRQFTYKLIANQLEENSTNIIPIYVKAKSLSKNIQEKATSPIGFVIGDSENSNEYHGNSTSSREEAVDIFIQSMLETEPELDGKIVRKMFSMQRNVFDNMYLIIDAYDEILSEERRMELISFIDDNLDRHKCPVVMTCRKSHKSELTNFFNEINGEVNTHSSLDIHFTPHELRFEMPTKLANAWGMNSDQLSLSAANLYKQYETVLTHPLFVGFFCMLLSHDALPPTDSKNPYLKQSKSNRKRDSDATVSLQHVTFLKRVIEFGLEINVKERRSISEGEIARIRKLFCYIAATYITTGLSNLENILKYVAKYHNISPTSREKQILNDNLGVMFVNSEKDIDWTHKTLPEVATGLLILEEPDYKKYLTNKHGSLFGRDGELWSECLLMTLIQDDLQNFGEDKSFPILKDLFRSMGKEALLRTLEMFSIENAKIFNLQYSRGKYSYKTKTSNKAQLPIINALADAFFDGVIKGSPFPIPIELIGNGLRGQAAADLFKRTNMSGGIYSDMFIEPEKAHIPKIGVDDIFERFEGDIDKICSFYWTRRSLRNTGKVFEGGNVQEKEFLQRLISEVERLPSQFEFSFELTFDMLCSSFTSRTRMELMEDITSRHISNSGLGYFESINLDLKLLDHQSLVAFNPILDAIRMRSQASKQVLDPDMEFMVLRFPNLMLRLVQWTLSPFKPSNKKISNSFEQTRLRFGLPMVPYDSMKTAIRQMDGQSEASGNFELIPPWVPTEVYCLPTTRIHKTGSMFNKFKNIYSRYLKE